MDSYQNLIILQNLYRLKALGFNYADHIALNETTPHETPNSFEELAKNISTCHLCDLSKSRKQSMGGYGNKNAKIMIIDFSVSKEQDSTNNYHTGRSGETLQKMLENVLNVSIEDTFYTHCVKCKTLSAAMPLSSELESCKHHLLAQINFVKPTIIITLGSQAYENITNDKDGFEKTRGHVIDFKNYTLIPIHHPSHLLRNPELKKTTLNDLKTIKSCL